MKRADKSGPRRAHTVAELEKKVRELEVRDAECSHRIALRTKELEAANAALRKLSLAVEDASDSIYITERSGTIEYVNNAVREMSGYSREELIGRNPEIFKSGKHDAAFYKDMWDTVHAGRTYHNIITNRKKNGELFEVYHTITPLKNEAGEITHFVATSKDLTRQRLLEERVNHLAYYDHLTDLPNMTLFLDRIKQELPRTEYRKRQVAVLTVNIDRFSFINETFGTESGDEVLREVGRRLSSVVRDGDTVARLGRDHFGVLLVDVAQSRDIVFVVTRIFSALERPLRVMGADIAVNLYIGISVSPQDTMDAVQLMANSEIAVAKARYQGLNSYQFFTSEMNQLASNFAVFQKSLLQALTNNEFVLHYQPYFNVATRTLAGIECLIRWNSPEHGFIYPTNFIPSLEDTRMIIQVGQWVVHEACRQIREWQDKGYAMVPVTTNLSAVQFKQADVGDFIETTVRESGIDPRNLAFELTESTMMENPEKIRLLLTRLKKLGISISTDDFGTGYSSLSYLKNLPLDNLKIDISFVKDITTNTDDGAIVSSIVSMAHNLRLKTIAEGVETAEQLKTLHELGCDMVQGFYLCRPVTAEAAEAILAMNQRTTQGL
jgi:diguanylate cyclase (GGDEF)-like protein/PAS domain S-box-containing protein